MARWKTTFLLLVLTVGIGAYISLYELKQPTAAQRQHRSQQVVDLPSDQVTQVVLDLPQVKATLAKRDGTWRLLPDDVRADPATINQWLYRLSPLTAQRVLSATAEHPLDLKTYGLDPAAGWISISTQARATTLLIGNPTPVQPNRYVKLADRPEVFVIPTALFDDANQPTEKFRDPFLLRVNAWTAEELRITTPTQRLALTRQDHEWLITQPLRDRADRTAVNQLLSTLERVSISRVVDDQPQVEQLSTWGFDQPFAQIHLRQGSEPAVTLFIGNPLPDDAARRYAKRSDERPLYAVLVSELEPLLPQPDALRAKACFEFFANAVTSVAVTNAGVSWTAQWAQGAWRGAETQAALSTERVQEWLQKLLDLRVVRFVEEAPSDLPAPPSGGAQPGLARYGLEAPGGMIAVSTSDGQPTQRLFVGAPLEGSLDRYGRIEGREAVVALPASITDLLVTTPEQLTTETSPTAPSQ